MRSIVRFAWKWKTGVDALLSENAMIFAILRHFGVNANVIPMSCQFHDNVKTMHNDRIQPTKV